MHALIVDDSRAMRSVLCHILKELKFIVSEAENGIDALLKLREGPKIQLMLVDWHMPVMGGDGLIKEVRAKSEYRDMKIVMVTTERDQEKIQQVKAVGIDGYIVKPFKRDVICNTIQSCVGLSM